MSDLTGKHIFGIVKVGAKGQIVIPKDAREIFSISTGDTLLVIGDETEGLAILKPDRFKNFSIEIFNKQEVKK